jgi:glutamine synthetase
MPIIVEYIWLGGNSELRSKTRVLNNEFNPSSSPADWPDWNYDGSSTAQAEGLNSELKIKPVAIYTNPFLESGYLLLCETFDKDNVPLPSNTRNKAVEIFDFPNTHVGIDEHPWFGIEQEYFILSGNGSSSPLCGRTQGQFYCSVGSKNAYFREVAEEHMQLCIKAGLTVSGINAEVAPCQWEYQIGPCEGIDSADQMWISRWIMERLSEKHRVRIDWSPKPFKDINGSGCHTNFSTQRMRSAGGLNDIYEAIEKLRNKHGDHMKVYGKDNDKRMSGLYETAKYDKFSFDLTRPVDRGASVRVGYDTITNKCGYFEDRRPASNMDPYLVTSKIFKTVCCAFLFIAFR